MGRAGTIAFVVLLGLGIWGLRATTMSVHEPVPPDSALTVHVRADTLVPADPVDRLTRAQVDLCVAEAIPFVDIVALERVERVDGGGGVDLPDYRFTTRPGADAPDRDQLRGCLEDLRLRHLRLSVVGMTMQADGGVAVQDGTM